METSLKTWLIVGLGNPGKKYEMTRHNIGNMVVQAYANKHGLSFKEEKKLKSQVLKFQINQAEIHLLLPTTYMNLSGEAVRKYMDYYKMGVDRLLVIVDDMDLPLGTLRLRPAGSAGGHNGLKSIEAHVNTKEYARLRVGIGRQKEGSIMSDYVLDRFNLDELPLVKQVLHEGVNAIDRLSSEEFSAVMKDINTRKEDE